MPFTFSHPLYAVPLHRAAPKWLSITGLLLGSMAPDLEYFAAMESYRTIGHTLTGFILLGLPLSIALAFAFHLVLKPVLSKFMPSAGGLDQFVQSLTRGKWEIHSFRSWVVFLASIFLGYLSHIFMDGWTHSSGIFVHVFPLLKHRIAGEGIYHWLQYGFSLLGLFIPALILLSRFIQWRQMSRLPERVQSVAAPSAKVLLWACAVGMGTLLFLLKCYFAYDRLWLGIFIVAPITSGLFGLFAASLLYMALQRRRLLIGAASLLMFGSLMLLYKTAAHVLHGQSELIGWVCYLILWSILLLAASRICGKD